MNLSTTPHRKIFDLSSLILIVSNIITIYIAVSQNWNLSTLMFVYWAQNAIIGLFTFAKILSLKKFSTKNFKINHAPASPTIATKYFTAFFFLVHYGMFHLIYFLFLVTNFSISNALMPVFFSILILFGNHLFSYIYNFKEDSNKLKSIGTIMFFPYARIIPMHLTIVFGYFLIQSSTGLIFFLCLKTLADLIMHITEHKI